MLVIFTSIYLVANSAALSKFEPSVNSSEKINTATEEQQAYSASTKELMESAEAFFTKGEYQKTINIYKEIISREPSNVEAHQQIAHTYRYWYKHEESEIWFKKAIALNPSNAFLYTDIGKLYRNMNEPEKAEAVFKKAIELNPNDDSVYSYGLGYLYFDQKRYEDSEAMFLKALEINPESDLGNSGLADLYREMGRYEESEAMYKKVFEINPNSEAYLGLGWLYIYQGKYEEALVPLQAFLTKIREKGEVYYTLGQAYSKLGRNDEAKNAFKRAVELVPDNPLFIEAYTQAQL